MLQGNMGATGRTVKNMMRKKTDHSTDECTNSYKYTNPAKTYAQTAYSRKTIKNL